jgi:hypothetical protein
MMSGATDADALIGDNMDIVIGRFDETMARTNAQIRLVMPIGNRERLRQFSRAGTKPVFVLDSAALFH